MILHLVGGFSPTHLKNMRTVKGSGWKFQKCLSCHHLAMLWSPLPNFFWGFHFMTFKTPHFHRTTGTNYGWDTILPPVLVGSPGRSYVLPHPRSPHQALRCALEREVRGGWRVVKHQWQGPKAKLRFRSPRGLKVFVFCTFSELNFKKLNPANWKIGYIKGISGTMHQRFAKKCHHPMGFWGVSLPSQ